MSVCPKPDKVKKTAKGAPAKFTANAPAPRTEACNTSVTTVTSGNGNSTSTVEYIPGPMGPKGDKGDTGPECDVLGFKWEGAWEEGGVYVKQNQPEHRNGSVVERFGKAWMCIEDHIAEISNGPLDAQHILDLDSESEPTTWDLHWELFAGLNGGSALLPEEKGFFDTLKDGIFDWIEKADLFDWLKAGAIAVGVVLAGNKIKDMMEGDPEETDVDQRYDGTPGTIIPGVGGITPGLPGSGPGGGTGVPGTPNENGNGADGFPGDIDEGGNGEPAYPGGPATYAAPKLKAVITSLCQFAGIIFNVDALSATDSCEFTVGQSTGVRSVLEQLSLAYQFDMVDSGGVLKFVPRQVSPSKTITLEDMGFDASGTPPAPYTATRFQGIDLPRNVSLTYSAKDMDYNLFTQTSELYTYEEGQVVSLQVPVTLSHRRAKQICELALVNSHLERMNYKFSTTYKFVDVEPGDVLNSPMGLIRILRVSEASEGVLEFEASDAGDETAMMGSGMNVAIPTPSTDVPVSIGKSQALWIDPNNLNDQDTGIRIYAAVHGYGKAGWPGAAIYMSEDGGNSYEQIGQTNQEATVGIVELTTPSQPAQVWDDTTQIVVKLKTGTLLPKSDIAVLNGDNICMIGNELIGFANAELIAPMTYRLSRLLRGRQGTEQYISLHEPDELFVLINDAVVRIALEDSDRGTTKQFKTVTYGSSLAVTTEDNVQIISNNTRMWQVYNAKAKLETNGDWTVTFNARARYNNSLQDFTTVNSDEDFGGFGIATLDLANITKSTQVVFTPKFTYTKAAQIADFGVAQNSVRISIVPMSKKWGGGYPLIINS